MGGCTSRGEKAGSFNGCSGGPGVPLVVLEDLSCSLRPHLASPEGVAAWRLCLRSGLGEKKPVADLIGLSPVRWSSALNSSSV
eukprot:9571045-Heterocapsa_arctica.AAC.1